jgi:hypothetical protein
VRESIIDASKISSSNNNCAAAKVSNEATITVLPIIHMAEEDLVLRLEVDRVDHIQPVVAFPMIIIRMSVDPQRIV